MRFHRAGLLALGAGGLLLLALLAVAPLPGTPDELVAGAASRAAVRSASISFYDWQNDTTLAVFGHCNHTPCGDAFAFRGDVVEKLQRGPWIIEPEGAAPVRYDPDAAPLSGRLRVPTQSPGYEQAGNRTVVPPMVVGSVWPPLLAYAAGWALACAGGAAALAGPRAGAPPVLAALMTVAAVSWSPVAAYLASFLLVPALVVSALFAAVARRESLAAGLVTSAIAVAAVLWTALPFFPSSGGAI